MTPQSAKPGKWCDTSWPVSPHVAATLVQAGFLGVARYVPLPGNSSMSDITGIEMGCLLDAGLQVLLVQHVRRPPWLPKQHDGTVDAGAAVTKAGMVAYPEGCHLYLDLEGCAGSPDDAAVFCNHWAAEVKRAGYLAGLYVGYSALLSPQELYDLPDFNTYWRDAGPRDVAVRGFAIKQGPEITIAGVAFDVDIVTPDGRGELPIVCGV